MGSMFHADPLNHLIGGQVGKAPEVQAAGPAPALAVGNHLFGTATLGDHLETEPALASPG